VTHDQEEALSVADRVGVMWQGRIQQIDSPKELYMRPVNPFVAEFVGQSNPLAGTSSGDTVTVLGQRIPLLPGSPGSGEVTVLIRPEAVRFEADRADGASDGLGAAGGASGTVTATSFLGSTGTASARLADGTEVTAQVASSQIETLDVGNRVAVVLEPVPALAQPRDE
jgi:putative spermidine/putrescine transport system ATP-binding protein